MARVLYECAGPELLQELLPRQDAVHRPGPWFERHHDVVLQQRLLLEGAQTGGVVMIHGDYAVYHDNQQLCRAFARMADAVAIASSASDWTDPVSQDIEHPLSMTDRTVSPVR
jgi:hypothetical protein